MNVVCHFLPVATGYPGWVFSPLCPSLQWRRCSLGPYRQLTSCSILDVYELCDLDGIWDITQPVSTNRTVYLHVWLLMRLCSGGHDYVITELKNNH